MKSKWPQRDDLPVVLVVLDGLGDRPCLSLGGRTPLEVASTPALDELAARGANGVHVPFGPGWATSSERSHWAMFGLPELAFPGRALLEWVGEGGVPPLGTPMWHLAARRGEQVDGVMRITGRMGSQHSDIAHTLNRILQEWTEEFVVDGVSFSIESLRLGEWVLLAHGLESIEVSDSDPLFDHMHPWMLPVPLQECVIAGGRRLVEAQRTADALKAYLLGAHASLVCAGLEITVPTTKWPSIAGQPLSFLDLVGVQGAMLTSSALYRGLARTLGMREIDVAATAEDPGLGLSARVQSAIRLLGEEQRPDFIHVHTKAPDEAGHTKKPEAKIAAIEACDAAIAAFIDIIDRGDLVLAVTGDHATPSEGLLMHSGDPTPIVVVAPEQRKDSVREFGETAALSGALGSLRAADIAPLLHGLARRPFFVGHRPGASIKSALPLSPIAMPVPGAEPIYLERPQIMKESSR